MRSISNPFLAAFDRELELALREVTGGSSALSASDVTALAVTLLQEAAEVVDIQGIDAAIKAMVSVDVAALQKAVALFEPHAGLQSKAPTFGGKLMTMGDRLVRMKGRVTLLQTVSEPLGIDLAMSFLGMSMTVALAILYENATPVPPELQELLSKKLAAIPEANVWNVWRQVQQEFAIDEDYPSYDPAGPEVPADFFSVSDAETARAHIATFLIEVKPKFFISRSQKGTKESPAIAPPLPAFLGISDAAMRRPGRRKEHLMVGISQTLSLWDDESRQNLLDALGIDSTGWVAQDSKERFAQLTKGAVGDALGIPHRLRALRRLLGYTDAFAQMGNPLEALLTSYKLSREVLAEKFRKEILEQKKAELQLQKEIASFLIEHGYFAVGTRFGQVESDLVIFEGREPLVLEVKKFTQNRPPTPAAIRQALRQLQDYLDKHKGFQRGVLALFNLSERPLKAPRLWIRGQYRVLAINLGVLTSSKIKSTLEIVEGGGAEVLHFISS